MDKTLGSFSPSLHFSFNLECIIHANKSVHWNLKQLLLRVKKIFLTTGLGYKPHPSWLLIFSMQFHQFVFRAIKRIEIEQLHGRLFSIAQANWQCLTGCETHFSGLSIESVPFPELLEAAVNDLHRNVRLDSKYLGFE